jgi:hypothetical protein
MISRNELIAQYEGLLYIVLFNSRIFSSPERQKGQKGIASTQLSYLEKQHPGLQEIKNRKLSNTKIKLSMKNWRRKFPDGVSEKCRMS